MLTLYYNNVKYVEILISGNSDVRISTYIIFSYVFYLVISDDGVIRPKHVATYH
jgi:hypothetical protein